MTASLSKRQRVCSRHYIEIAMAKNKVSAADIRDYINRISLYTEQHAITICHTWPWTDTKFPHFI
jgi:hypothetical protein